MSNDVLTHKHDEVNHCPACWSDDISYADTFNDGSILVTCGDCYAKWYEVWSWVGITLIEDGDGNPVLYKAASKHKAPNNKEMKE
mgnify:CR=1 FL=1